MSDRSSASIRTARLTLRPWREDDLDAFAAMHADPEVMVDYGGPLDRAKSAAKLVRYADTFARYGHSRWAIEHPQDGFIGYAGINPLVDEFPLAPGVEIGWRMVRSAWGEGYASEAAKAALDDGFARFNFAEVFSYTGPSNLRSQAVMARLGLLREPHRDFSLDFGDGAGRWLVWRAPRPAQAA